MEGPADTALIADLLNPADPPGRQMEKLLRIVTVLMRRVEQITDDGGAAYAQFQRAAMLEDQVSARTRDLERALDLLNDSNARLEAANRETEAARQNLANAIETVQEGFALFDAGDAMVMCNSRFGMHMPDIRPALVPGLRFDAYIDRVSRSGHLVRGSQESPADWAVQRRRRHQDRHVTFNVPLTGDRWLQVSEHRTPDGGTVILQTDVTDIIRQERHARGKLLDDQARVIRATLDHITQGVGIFDAEARLVAWNLRLGALLGVAGVQAGVSFDSLLRRIEPDLRAGGLTPAQLSAWAEGFAGRSALSFLLPRAVGTILNVVLQEIPGQGFLISLTDVTAERTAIAALSRANETLEARVLSRTLDLEDALAGAERANASRSRFVAAASHDLLQPLSAAKLFIASIGDGAVDAGTRAVLSKAQNALVSVEGILGALLDISKLELGKAAVSVGPVALDRLLAQLNEEFAPVAAAKGLALRVVASGAVVASDPTYLRRILQNLIGNAIRYTERGRVVVGARRRGGEVRLEVWDSGPGIAEADREAIFREFHRLNARASASEGMGLGLAIVERACALLGHPLGLVSVPGRGTGFWVQVPRADGPAEAEAPLAVPRLAGQDRIAFLVEADAHLRHAMGLLLENWGMSVLEAGSGDEAFALIEELGILPDVFLVDHDLGVLSGLGFVRAVRARYGAVPACLLTGDRSAAMAAICAEAGVGLLRKPIDARALEAMLLQLGG